MVIALVILARVTGNLQSVEQWALDYGLRLRPPEPTDERILIVGINEKDIRTIGKYPIPDRNLAELLQALRQEQPTVIGLDIVRDLPVEPGHAELVRVFRETSTLIGVEKVLPDQSGFAIAPPPDLPLEQVGFGDAILDTDGYLRRSLLGTPDFQRQYKFSLTLRLAEYYLSGQGMTLSNGTNDPKAMQFGATELPRFLPDSGGYVATDDGGTQVLLNFRSGQTPFRIVSMADVLTGNVPKNWIRDRIVLVGVMSLSAKDVINTAAIQGSNPGLVYGVEIQAHAVSQIVSAVLDGRPLLQVWADDWEYLWIFAWGFLGISLGRIILSPLKVLLGLGVACMALVGICYGLLLAGWWIPVVPAVLALVLNGAGLTASMFYRHEQNLKTKIQDRQLIIEQTFDTIHNGPLQTLAKVLRDVQEREMTTDPLYLDLKQLNQELRAVYESVRREALTQGSCFQFSSDLKLDLQDSIHEVLYEVYNHTVNRDLPCFKTLKLKVTTFKDMDSYFLTIEQKKGLCRFLEESLCNVGKHAIGVTRLDVICMQEQGQNVIRVIDNGVGVHALPESSKMDQMDQMDQSAQLVGRGTQQAKDLAQQLGGTFRRFSLRQAVAKPNSPSRTICELTWEVTKPWFWGF
jgi:CHASE2 domain-containing sensor protein/two-component sensor histidine kinase